MAKILSEVEVCVCLWQLWKQSINTRYQFCKAVQQKLLFSKFLGSLTCSTNPKNSAIIVKCLAQGHKCHGRDSNPHSADYKHQSLCPMLLTDHPWHTVTLQVPWLLCKLPTKRGLLLKRSVNFRLRIKQIDFGDHQPCTLPLKYIVQGGDSGK